MRKYSSTRTISSIVLSKDKYNLTPIYQRNEVWASDRKQLLIDTILRQYDMPKIYLEQLPEGGRYEYNVIDGQQRLTSIFGFTDNDFPVGQISEDLEAGNLVGKYYAELDAKQQDYINSYELAVIQLDNATDQEIRELFRRLQEGVSLTPPEKRNAMLGNMADFVRDQASQNKIFTLVKVSNKRLQHHDFMAIVTALELYNFNTEVSAAYLAKMYKNETKFAFSGKTAKKIKKVLKLMHNVLSVAETPEMDIKWGFVDLYSILSEFSEYYVLKGREAEINTFYTTFETERRNVSDKTTLLSTGSSWDRDLYEYIEAFESMGAKIDSLETRLSVYKRRFLRDLPALKLRDKKRFFTKDERIFIWRRAKGICQLCTNQVPFSDVEADHHIPWSAGGSTELDNAKCLCRSCNSSKSATIPS